MAGPDFLVHDAADTVGVVVVETAEAGKDLKGLVMETGESLTVTSLDAIPLGHKIALGDLSVGDTVLKYGHDIGKIVAAVKKGGHVHTQNLKTKRW